MNTGNIYGSAMCLPNKKFLLLNSREVTAMRLIQEGHSLLEAGKQLGVSAQRARQIIRSAKYKLSKEPHWMDGLSVRAANCLNNCSIHSLEDAMRAYQSGKLKPFKHPRGYGWKTHKEVAKFLCLPEPIKPPPRIPKTCPHCGGKL